jgi:hypothetical protein
MPWIVTRLPADYFSHGQRTSHEPTDNKAPSGIILILAKNVFGAVLLLLGIIMLLTPRAGLADDSRWLDADEFSRQVPTGTLGGDSARCAQEFELASKSPWCSTVQHALNGHTRTRIRTFTALPDVFLSANCETFVITWRGH